MIEQFICPFRLSDDISYFHMILSGLKKKKSAEPTAVVEQTLPQRKIRQLQ